MRLKVGAASVLILALWIIAPPALAQVPSITNVTNAAIPAIDYPPGPVHLVPGSIASIFGTGLADSTVSISPPWQTALAGTEVHLVVEYVSLGNANIPCGGTCELVADLLYASPTQINFVVPSAPAYETSRVVLIRDSTRFDNVSNGPGLVFLDASGGDSAVFGIGYDCLFSFSLTDPSSCGLSWSMGQHRALVGAVTDASGRLINFQNPMTQGQVIVVYMTGLSGLTLDSSTGLLDLQHPGPLGFGIAQYGTDIPATVMSLFGFQYGLVSTPVPLWAGETPQYMGLDQINVNFPVCSSTTKATVENRYDAFLSFTRAGLFFRSFHNASSVQPGFDMTNLSMSRFYLSNAGYSAHEQHLFCRKLRERMEAQPGVLGVTYSDVIPLANPGKGMPYHQLEVDGYIPRRDEQMILQRATVPPGYFRLMDIPLLKGRDFTGMDGENKPLVIVVNETFARRFFGGRDPIGRKVRVEHQPATVIGLVKDSKYGALIETQLPFFYIPFDQWFAPGLNFAVMLKTSGDPILLTPVLQREALALNPDAVFHTSRMEDATEASLYPQRVAATLLSVVGAVCLVLAAIGLYCVMSYAVSQRTQELGVRLALGASRSDVLVLVVREGLRLTVPGLVAGIAAALGAARLVSGMLFQVSAADPATFAAAAMFLGLVAGIASYLPAVRATRLDPMRAIRCQ